MTQKGISNKIFMYFRAIVFILLQKMHSKTLRAVFSKLFFLIQKSNCLRILPTDFADSGMKRQTNSIPKHLRESFPDISIFDISNIASKQTFYPILEKIQKKQKKLRQSKKQCQEILQLKCTFTWFLFHQNPSVSS